MDVPVVVNESSWLPGPYDNWGPTQPMEELKKLEIILWEYKEFLFIWEMELTVYI